MNLSLSTLLVKLIKSTPKPIRTVIKDSKIGSIMMHKIDKNAVELSFQKKWMKVFKENKSLVLDYWKKYRYLDEINKICKITKKTKVLDVGCGISSVLHYVKGEKYGIDPLANEFLRIYEYPKGIIVKEGAGEKIEFPDNSFDIVFCSNVLDHISNAEKTIEEIFRVLKKNGFFILTIGIFNENTYRGLAHPHSFTKEKIYALLNKFKVIFNKESLCIGLKDYVDGLRKVEKKELILISKKRNIKCG